MTSASPKPRAGEHVTETREAQEARLDAMLVERLVGPLRAERDLLRERERELVEALDLACHWAKHNGFGEGMMAEAHWLDKARTILAKHGR